jgi:hypothetical protein
MTVSANQIALLYFFTQTIYPYNHPLGNGKGFHRGISMIEIHYEWWVLITAIEASPARFLHQHDLHSTTTFRNVSSCSLGETSLTC